MANEVKTENSFHSSDVKSHGEISQIIDDIKEFERNIQKFEITNIVPEITEENVKSELKKVKNKKQIKNIRKSKPKKIIKRQKSTKKSGSKKTVGKNKNVANPATFHLKLNENGELVNLDFRKKEKKSVKETKLFNLITKISEKIQKSIITENEESKLGFLKNFVEKIKNLRS
ncbi:MAG: hypothetical protein V5A68_04215 [Candidatus Thermoplasmatota archaeon]